MTDWPSQSAEVNIVCVYLYTLIISMGLLLGLASALKPGIMLPDACSRHTPAPAEQIPYQNYRCNDEQQVN